MLIEACSVIAYMTLNLLETTMINPFPSKGFLIDE